MTARSKHANRYDRRFKAAVLRVIEGGGVTVADLCARVRVSQQSVYRWKRDSKVLVQLAVMDMDTAVGILDAVEHGEYDARAAERADREASDKRAQLRRVAETAREHELKSAPKKRGQTSILEQEEVREALLRGLRAAVPYRFIAAVLRVTPMTLTKWLQDAREGKGAAGKYAAEICGAEFEGIVEAHENAMAGAPGAQHALQLLQRRFPADYTTKIEVEATQGTPLESYTDEELRALALGDGAEASE